MGGSASENKIYLVTGEASGDALGADLIDAVRDIVGNARFTGLAGAKMRAKGMDSLFDISDISVMGFAAVASRLPTIIKRIRQTADDIVAAEPSVVVMIDSPEFCKRVAQRVKAKRPDIPIVKYICPSVWAWRPARARNMVGYLDHVLAILPFEPQLLADLGGPPATFVGHPLAHKYASIQLPDKTRVSPQRCLLLLPGSRRSETRLLLPDMAKTLEILAERQANVQAVLLAVDHLADEIGDEVSRWKIKPRIVSGEAGKLEAFAMADVALAASGTVLLELALNQIPMISIYRLDWLIFLFRHLITGWSAALPNLITDEAFVPERVNDMVRPGWIARAIEALLRAGPERQAQLLGFSRMAQKMAQSEAPGSIAARTIVSLMRKEPG